MYSFRDYVDAGGLMSYGIDLPEVYRQIGVYAGRILKGAKPADLPVMQPTKFEFVINLKTAKALGLEVPAEVAVRRRRGDRVMKRREFITLLGGATAAWPMAARGQQQAMPVVGFLHSISPDMQEDRLRAFRQGLKDTGYVEGENVAIIYRWAEGQNDRLPRLAAELVHRQVAVIAAIGNAPLAAKAATTTIPIVFAVPEDPVRSGLVASLARPGGNLSGINIVTGELTAKRLELLRELMPSAMRVGLLVNPTFSATETTVRDVEAAARAIGLQIQLLNASTPREIDAAFATLVRERSGALFIGGDPFFTSRRVQLANLARHVVPMTSGTREITEVGGLMSYGSNILDVWRQLGVYAGRILKGAKPADMPVAQQSKFELVINAQTARTLGLAVPPGLTRPRRRGDRVTRTMSPYGTFETSGDVRSSVAMRG